MIEKYCLDDFQRQKVLPVFVSLAQISEHARKEPNEFRLHLNAHIVQRCIETLETNKNSLQPDLTLLQKALKAIKILFGLENQEDGIDSVIHSIKDISDNLMFKLQFDLTSESLLNKSAQKDEFASKVGVKLPSKIGAVTAERSEKTSLETASEESVMYVGTKLVHRDASSFIIEFLRQIQTLLNLNYVLILLDECSEASASAQTEVFRLFKAIRGARPSIPNRPNLAFFLGGVYPHGETYYPNRAKDGFSFEPGQDSAIEFIQWDEIDAETYISFFKNMTVLRAREFLGFTGGFDELRNDLFDMQETFFVAAYCSNGIPRRYWQILKQAYDENAKKILFSGVDGAIQEIANNQLLALGNINEEDLSFSNELINILSNKNIDIRRKNEQMKNKRNPIPQNIYFSINRQFSAYLSRLIMQGVIHDKSRMRTLRRRAMQPMYAIDIAIAYAFRIIPPKSLSSVMKYDIPKCPLNNFDQAPEVRPKIVKNIYKGAESISVGEPDEDDSTIATGVVASYDKDKFGYIRVNDGGANAFFWSNQVALEYRESLNQGDKVKFHVKNNARGRQALRIEIVEVSSKPANDGQILKGKIISYNPSKFGFIDLLDGNPNALFLSHELDELTRGRLKIGVLVECRMKQDEKGRFCYDLKLLESNE